MTDPTAGAEPTEVRGTPVSEGSAASASEPAPARTPRTDPLGLLPVALAVGAALMLLGAIVFAFASAASTHVGAADRFRLLGGAAHPLTALTALTAMVLVVEDRARRTERVALAPVASGVATAVSLAVVLLGINGVLTDLTGSAGALFRLSSLITRLAPIGLAGFAVWLSVGGRRPDLG